MQTLKLDKETIYINIAILIVVFFIFFWNYSFFSNKIAQTQSRTTDLLSQIKKVQVLVKKLDNNRLNNYTLNIGLLSFIQQISTENHIDNHIINLKTINSGNDTETVYVKFNSLNLSEILKVIHNIEQYSNLYIKKLSISKQQNNNLASMAIIITKT